MRTISLVLTVLVPVLFSACSRDPARAAADYVKSGERYMSAGKLAEAIIEYRNAVKLAPDWPDARLKLAEAAVRAGDPVTYAQEILRVAELSAHDAAAQTRAASLLLLAGDLDGAKTRAEAALQLDPRQVVARVVLGQALARQGQPEAGGQRLAEAIRLAPDDSDVRVALASHYWSTARRGDAEQELQRALQLAPASPVVHRAMALIYMATDRIAQAEPHWRQVATNPGGDPLAVADYFMVQGRWDDVERELEGAARGAEIRGSALLRLADVRRARGALDAALETVRQAEAAGAPPASTALLRGAILSARYEDEAALQAFTTAVEADPTNTMAALGIAEIRSRQGHVTDAVQWTERARQWSPHSPVVRAAYITALVRAGRTRRATDEASQATRDWPESAGTYTQLGEVFAHAGQKREAREVFSKALTIDARYVPAIRSLVSLDLADNRQADARRRVENALRLAPGEPPLQLLAAETEAALGNVDRAETLLTRMITTDETNLAAYAALGHLYLRQQRLESALAQFQQVAQRDPTPASRTVVAQILDASGRREESRRHYEQVLVRYPTDAVAANNLAWIYQMDGRLDDALKLALVARARHDRAPEVADTLGWIYFRRGQFQEAILPLSDAVRGRPDHPLYRAHLGQAYWRAGDAAQALRELRIALASSQDFAGREEAQAAALQLEASAGLKSARPTSSR